MKTQQKPKTQHHEASSPMNNFSNLVFNGNVKTNGKITGV